MKKFAMLALAMSLFLVACGEKKEEQKPAEQPAAEATATTATTTEAPAAEVKAFSVKTEDGKEFTLEVVADGATATLTDAEGKVTELKNAETASEKDMLMKLKRNSYERYRRSFNFRRS